MPHAEMVTPTSLGKMEPPLEILPFGNALNILKQYLNSPRTEVYSIVNGVMTPISVQENKDIWEIPGKVVGKVASPQKVIKDTPSWIKHKIYNTRSKMLAEKEKVSMGELELDKVQKFTLVRKTLISKAKNQAKIEAKIRKQAIISRALRARKAQVRVP